MATILVSAETLATQADVNAAANGVVASLSASLTAIAAQISALATAESDDATLAQLTAARDQILTAIASISGGGQTTYDGKVS